MKKIFLTTAIVCLSAGIYAQSLNNKSHKINVAIKTNVCLTSDLAGDPPPPPPPPPPIPPLPPTAK